MISVIVAVVASLVQILTLLVFTLPLCSKKRPEGESKSNQPPGEGGVPTDSGQNKPPVTTSKKEVAAQTPQSKSHIDKQPPSGGAAVPIAIVPGGADGAATPTAAGGSNGSGGDKKKEPQKSDAGAGGVGVSVQKTTKDGQTAQSTAGNVSHNNSVVPGQDGVDQEGKPKVEKTVMLTLRQKKGEESDAGDGEGGEAIDAGGKDGTDKKKKKPK